MIIIENIDGVKQEIGSEEEFMEFAKEAFKENGEFEEGVLEPLETYRDCLHYVKEFCEALTFSQDHISARYDEDEEGEASYSSFVVVITDTKGSTYLENYGTVEEAEDRADEINAMKASSLGEI